MIDRQIFKYKNISRFYKCQNILFKNKQAKKQQNIIKILQLVFFK